MRMIGAVSPVSGGTLRVLGRDPASDGPRSASVSASSRRRTTSTSSSTWARTSLIYGRFFGLPRDEIRGGADELLEFVQLADRRERAGRLALRRHEAASDHRPRAHQRARADAARRADHRARPAGAPRSLWDRLYRLKQRGVTLVLTTHYMDEAEQLCDRLVIMDRAKIVAEGSPRELIDRFVEREVVELRVGRTSDGAPPLDGIRGRVEVLQDRIVIDTDDGDAVADRVHARGLQPETVLVRRSDPRGRVPAPHRPQPGRLDGARPPHARRRRAGTPARSAAPLARLDHGVLPQPDLLPRLDRPAPRQARRPLATRASVGSHTCSSSRLRCSRRPRCRRPRARRRTRSRPA